MRRMIAHAKLVFDHDCHALCRPDLTTETERLGSAGQQGWQLRSLFGGQFRLWARGRATPKSLGPLLLGAAHPLAYGAWADSQSCRNLPLRPPLLRQFPSTQPATFAPIVWWFCTRLFHTVYYTTYFIKNA